MWIYVINTEHSQFLNVFTKFGGLARGDRGCACYLLADDRKSRHVVVSNTIHLCSGVCGSMEYEVWYVHVWHVLGWQLKMGSVLGDQGYPTKKYM